MTSLFLLVCTTFHRGSFWSSCERSSSYFRQRPDTSRSVGDGCIRPAMFNRRQCHWKRCMQHRKFHRAAEVLYGNNQANLERPPSERPANRCRPSHVIGRSPEDRLVVIDQPNYTSCCTCHSTEIQKQRFAESSDGSIPAKRIHVRFWNFARGR